MIYEVYEDDRWEPISFGYFTSRKKAEKYIKAYHKAYPGLDTQFAIAELPTDVEFKL